MATIRKMRRSSTKVLDVATTVPKELAGKLHETAHSKLAEHIFDVALMSVLPCFAAVFYNNLYVVLCSLGVALLLLAFFFSYDTRGAPTVQRDGAAPLFDFDLPDAEGERVALSSHVGEPVAVFFIPGVGPGCHKQLCTLEDRLKVPDDDPAGFHCFFIVADGTSIEYVKSWQSKFAASHCRTVVKFLVDGGNSIRKKWRVPQNTLLRLIFGAGWERATYIFDKEGLLRRAHQPQGLFATHVQTKSGVSLALDAASEWVGRFHSANDETPRADSAIEPSRDFMLASLSDHRERLQELIGRIDEIVENGEAGVNPAAAELCEHALNIMSVALK